MAIKNIIAKINKSLFLSAALHFALFAIIFINLKSFANLSSHNHNPINFNLLHGSENKARNSQKINHEQRDGVGAKKEESFSEAVFEAPFLNNSYPKYPELAKRRGEEGQVLLQVTVGENGLAKEIKIAKSSSFKMLDLAAVEAIKKWQFVPAKKFGQAVTSSIIIPITFKLT